ncbi:hypothetical protein G5V59_08285 [Nocardioides sp. W3-2-3]|uniref:hypothetical protein n=1 Tax=Nocardioides convexus TaxID=2712224 RepID=UPI00241895B9|nr:hypothetical protein [Nocardioides convexus]NHA00145.1 hypothetical protein [Nocardioides convexus]
MSDLFDEDPERPAPERPGRRARALVITGVILVLGFFLLTAFASVYTDRLWYKEVGYGRCSARCCGPRSGCSSPSRCSWPPWSRSTCTWRTASARSSG